MKKVFLLIFGIICAIHQCSYTEPIDNPVNSKEDSTYTPMDTMPNSQNISCELTIHDSLAREGNLMIVKFADKSQLDYVVLGHPIKKYNGLVGMFEYDKGCNLCLNYASKPESSSSTLSDPIVTFLTDETQIIGTSPYIYLADDYYLIDWKWLQLLPLSCLTNYTYNTQHILRHIQEHVFLTDIRWKDLTDLRQNRDVSQYTQQVSLSEVWRISTRLIDKSFDEEKSLDPYVCYNLSLYQEGMSVENAYLYYRGEAVGTCHQADTYKEYISYCDSLQQVYQQHLIEMINSGQLK